MARKGTLTKVITLPGGGRKWLYAKTEEELNKKYYEAMGQLARGVQLLDQTTFGEYAQMWYKTFKEPFIRTKTKEMILNVLNTHLLPYISGYRMKDITPMHIQMVFNHLTNHSVSLNNKVKMVLNNIFTLALENGIVSRSPVVSSLKIGGVKPKVKEALSPEDVTELLETLSDDPCAGAQNCYLFCLLALKTGLRLGEMCGLMWTDIDFEKEELTVNHNCQWPKNTDVVVTDALKTENANRTIPIPKAAMMALRREKAKTNSFFVFHRRDGQVLTQSAFSKMWAHTNKAAIEASLTPHVLRHTYCTRLFEAGLDIKEIQYLMGHSKPDLTLEIYTHYCKKSRFEDTASRIRAAL